MADVYIGSYVVDTTPPVVSNPFPAPAAISVAPSTNISFDITDVGGDGVDLATLVVYIDATLAISGGVFQAGFTGSITPIVDGYTVVIDPTSNFDYEQSVTVTVDAADLSPVPHVMTTYVWSFLTAAPAVIPQGCPLYPLMPVEERLLLPFPTTALETVRRAALDMVSLGYTYAHRARAITLTTYKNDFSYVFQELLAVPAVIRAEAICRRRPLFEMASLLPPLQLPLAQAQEDLQTLGCSDLYRTAIEARSNSHSPQHRVSALCATALMAATLLLEEGKYDVTSTNRFTSQPATPTTPTTPILDQSFGTALSVAAPLTTLELRLRTSFVTPGLEVLRRGVLQLVTGSNLLDQRIRSALLLAYRDDFLPVFADLAPVSPAILREAIPKQRKLFTMLADLRALDHAAFVARQELRAAGVAESYVTLLDRYYLSATPQYRVTAACAHLFFGALVYPDT